MLNRRVRKRTPRSAPGLAGNALGERIRKARKELGLSLAGVAGKDFSRAFLNQVELGRARPSTRTLQIIAERLQRPIEYFLQDPEVSGPALELTLVEAETCLHRGDAARAEGLVSRLLERSIPLEVRTRAQLILAGAWQRKGAAQQAIPVLQEAIASAERSGWTTLAVELYDRMGSAYYLLRRPHDAARWFDRALETYDRSRLKDPLLKARILGHRANLHYVAGEPGEAIAAYESAIAAAEHVLDMPGLAGIYEGLAVSFQRTGQFSRALTYAQRSLRIFESLQDVRMSAQLRLNMGEMLLQQGRAEEAERLFDAGAAQLERIGDRELYPYLLAGAAEAALELGALGRAGARVAQALEAVQVSSDPIATVGCYRVAGRFAHAGGRSVESHAHFERALDVARTIESPEIRARVTYDYARALEAEGNTADAALRFREAYEARRVPAGA